VTSSRSERGEQTPRSAPTPEERQKPARRYSGKSNLELWYVGQPAGQRVPDLIRYVTQFHAGEVRKALRGESV
jgi:hypothetical protein